MIVTNFSVHKTSSRGLVSESAWALLLRMACAHPSMCVRFRACHSFPISSNSPPHPQARLFQHPGLHSFPRMSKVLLFLFSNFFFFFPCSWTNASCSASCMPRGSSSPGLGKCAGSVFYFPTLCISLECELLSQAVFMAEGAVGEVPSLLPWQPRWMMFSAGPGDLVL